MGGHGPSIVAARHDRPLSHGVQSRPQADALPKDGFTGRQGLVVLQLLSR